MKKVIIIRWSEIHLKGKNRGHFEGLLEDNIKRSLKKFKYKFVKILGRYLIEEFNEFEELDIVSKLKKISGIHTISIANSVNTSYEDIENACLSVCEYKRGTFKVETRRAYKQFPMQSIDVSKKIGGAILSKNKDLTVDVHEPNFTVYIDIRDANSTLVYTDVIKTMGGMPVGSAAKGMLMISGGIDSPVAGYMMAKRGMKLDAIHFHSYPYTGEAAKEKVITLTEKVAEYTGGINLHVVPFTEIQEAIHEKCPEEYMITMMRRFMMRIAERVAKSVNALAIITGESLGQVASQTVESITSSNSVATLPVLRPLIAFDKIDIIEIAEKIDTYETSILPYEDCCTVFLPKFPIIKPKLEKVIEFESVLDIENLIDRAISNIEIIEI